MSKFETLSILRQLAVLTALLLVTTAARAVSLEELRNDSKLTPQRFARYFADFEYQRRGAVQAPADFLRNRNGDCDDYAILAATILKEKGYTPRLITVRLPGDNHVVCYIEETRSYLDFNNRGYLLRTVSCGGSLEEIARKVARSLDSSWNSASEFIYEGNSRKRFLRTVAAKGATTPGLLLAKYP